MQYLRYWSLSESPFAPSAARFFFSGSPQRDLLAWIQDRIIGGQRSALVVSPSGHGVTTLLRNLTLSTGFDDCAAAVVYTSGRQPSVDHVFAQLASVLGVSPRRRPMESVVMAIDDLHRQSLRTVWLVDELGKHSADAVAQLSRHRLSLTTIASVTPSLQRLVIKSLGARIARTEFRSLNHAETKQYVAHSLQVAGCRRLLFNEAAVTSLHRHSGGRLRTVAHLAEHALVLGAEAGLSQITPREMDIVQRESKRAA
ncbi:MAG: hypothetical protein HKN47_13205 [Pirellulaceae bacterium]|nr:hypothetical protein [Pirellulaceae bacterium]